MHGRSRETQKISEEEKAAKAAKLAKYIKLKDSLLQMHKTKQYDGPAYELSAKLVEVNPDFYTLYNFRRLVLQDMMAKSPEKKRSLLEDELTLTERALQKNPKSYGTWHQRVWVVSQDQSFVPRELALVTKFLQLDSRNFHGWNYRRIVAELAYAQGILTPADEFAYTTKQINTDFSNYSAWHYRTVLIPRLLNPQTAAPVSLLLVSTPAPSSSSSSSSSSSTSAADAPTPTAVAQELSALTVSSSSPAPPAASNSSSPAADSSVTAESSTPSSASTTTPPAAASSSSPSAFSSSEAKALRELLEKEFVYVRNAFYTMPTDQSAWLYHRWLLARVLAPGTSFPVLGMELYSPEKKTASSDQAEPAWLHWQIEVYQRELGVCRELAEEEPN